MTCIAFSGSSWLPKLIAKPLMMTFECEMKTCSRPKRHPSTWNGGWAASGSGGTAPRLTPQGSRRELQTIWLTVFFYKINFIVPLSARPEAIRVMS